MNAGPLKAIRGPKTVPRGRTILAPFQGAFGLQPRSGGIAGAQPPANLWQPFRLTCSGRRYVEDTPLVRTGINQ